MKKLSKSLTIITKLYLTLMLASNITASEQDEPESWMNDILEMNPEEASRWMNSILETNPEETTQLQQAQARDQQPSQLLADNGSDESFFALQIPEIPIDEQCTLNPLEIAFFNAVSDGSSIAEIILPDNDASPKHTISQPNENSLKRTHTEDAESTNTLPAKIPTDTTTLTDKKTFKCNHCGRIFTKKINYKKHELIHTGEKNYKCTTEGCGKSFTQSNDLTKHIRTHTKEKPYNCTIGECRKSFAQPNHLTKHTRTHTGEKPYKCTVEGCGKSFSESYSRVKHIRTHTGEKNYKCTIEGCGNSFSESCSLTAHIRTHTGEKPYKCSHCGKSFSQSSNCKTHEKRLHKQQYSEAPILNVSDQQEQTEEETSLENPQDLAINGFEEEQTEEEELNL